MHACMGKGLGTLAPIPGSESLAITWFVYIGLYWIMYMMWHEEHFCVPPVYITRPFSIRITAGSEIILSVTSLWLFDVPHPLLSANHSLYQVLQSIGVTDVLKVLLECCVLHSKVHTSQVFQRLPTCTSFCRLSYACYLLLRWLLIMPL